VVHYPLVAIISDSFFKKHFIGVGFKVQGSKVQRGTEKMSTDQKLAGSRSRLQAKHGDDRTLNAEPRTQTPEPINAYSDVLIGNTLLGATAVNF
jgi:hypothetical protein